MRNPPTRGVNQSGVLKLDSKKVLFLLIVLFSLVVVTNQDVYAEYDRNFITPDYEMTLIENTDNCFIDCYAIVDVYNPSTTKTISTVTVKKIDLLLFEIPLGEEKEMSFDFVKEKPTQAGLNDYDIYRLVNQSYWIDVPEYQLKEVCEDVPKNGTFEAGKVCHEENIYVGSHKELKTKESWVKFDYESLYELKPQETWRLKVVGHKKPTLGNNNVDWLVDFMGYSPSWAWWNSSFDYKKNINITNPDDEPLIKYHTVNFTMDTATLITAGKMKSDCSDLRIVYADTTELNRTFLNNTFLGTTGGCNDANTVVFFMTQANISATSEDTTNYYVYYGYSDADNEPNNTMGVFLLYDDFNGASLDSAWQEKGTCGVDGAVHSLKVSSNSDACQRNFDVGGVVLPNYVSYWNWTLTGTDGNNNFIGVNVSAMETALGYWEISNMTYQEKGSIEGSKFFQIYNTSSNIVKENATGFVQNGWYAMKTIHTHSNGEFVTSYNGNNIVWSSKNYYSSGKENTITYGYRVDFNRANAYVDNVLVMRYQDGSQPVLSLGDEENQAGGPDVTSPYWSNVLEGKGDPSTYPNSGDPQDYGFQVTFQDETGMENVTFIHNETGFWQEDLCSNSGSVYYYNITSMAVGIVNYTFVGYDTSGNSNSTEYYTFEVVKGQPYYEITGSVPHGAFDKVYGQQAQIWVGDYGDNDGDADITYYLYRNGTEIAGLYDSTTILKAGIWNYTATNTVGQNYTVATADVTRQIVTISQATPNVTINATNGTYPIGQPIYYGIQSLYNQLSGGILYNGTPFANNTDPSLGVGMWNITAYASGNENYTFFANTTWVNSSHAVGDDLFNVTSVVYSEFVNETGTYNYETTIFYNKWYIDDLNSSLIWNGTEYPATEIFSNTTHYIFNRSFIGPLLSENNTEVSLNFNNTFHFLLNDTTTEIADDSYTQNITYAYYIDSLDTDSANYVEGEDADLELYVVDLVGRANLTANFTFYYNGSYYDTENTSSYTNVGGLKLYEATFNTLSNTNNTETKNIIGNLTIRYNGSSRVLGETDSATVYKMIITECGNITNSTTVTVSYYNELDFTARNGSLGLIRFLLTSGEVTREYAFENTTANYSHSFCIYPSWANHDASIYLEYEDTDTPRRPYYIVNTTLSDDPETIKAFLLNDTYAYYTNIYLYDENGATMPQYYIRILKYNPDIDASETLFIGRTDDSGIFATFLRPLEQAYSYVVTDSSGEIIYQTEQEVITCISGTCPPYEKHIYVDPSELDSLNIGDIQAIYDFNETTSTLTMTISDSSGLATELWVSIDEVGDFGRRTNYFNQTYESSTLAFSEVMPNTTEEYEVRVWVKEFDKWYPLITRPITMENIMALGILGILIAFVLTLSLEVGGLVLGGPVLGLVGVGGGLAISRLFNLIPLPFVGLYSVLFVVGMIIYLLAKGD